MINKMATAKALEEIVKELPPEDRQELEEHARSLLEKHAAKAKQSGLQKLKLDWRGGLKDLRDQFTSVELQHKALEWWEEDVSR